MIDAAKTCLFVPAELKKFKLDLFNRIGEKIAKQGGVVIRGDWKALARLPDDIIPIIGGAPYIRPMLNEWIARGRKWIYWDRGYARRVFATWLPRGSDMGIAGGYYRWHLNAFQMQRVRDVPADRWASLKTPVQPWQKNPRGHVVIAIPSPTYQKFHQIEGWTERTCLELAKATTRQLVIRDKETKRSLQDDTRGAYCLVTHGSNTAVESVILGCPVIVHPDSAAALVGITDITMLEKIRYPDREKWLHSLAYCQFNETELVDGTLWRLIE